LFEITGKGSDDLDCVRGEVWRQPGESRSFDDGQIVAIDDVTTAGAGGLDEETEVFA
jgi:hypothetical protein